MTRGGIVRPGHNDQLVQLQAPPAPASRPAAGSHERLWRNASMVRALPGCRDRAAASRAR
jgi:hypothetical protein